MPNQYIFDDTGPATYEFRDVTAPLQDYRRGKPRRQNSYGGGDDDGTGSLTYSAASSITNESTDSSFAGIKKVLELHGETSKDLASFVRKQHRTAGDESCTADSLAYSAKSATSDSLAYSVDAESYMRSLAADGEASYRSRLQGTALLSNGQQSSQSGFDGGSYASAMGASYLNNGGGQRHEIGDDGNVFMMFSPAEHTDSMKRRKEKKRRERSEQRLSSSTSTDTRDKDSQPVYMISPQTTPTRSSRSTEAPAPSHGRIVSPTFWPDEGPTVPSKSSPPRASRPPLHRGYEDATTDEDDVWYAKWWTLCFPDTLKSVDPKR